MGDSFHGVAAVERTPSTDTLGGRGVDQDRIFKMKFVDHFVDRRTIAAAPLVEMPLRYLLSESGIDLDRDNIRIVATPGAHEPGVSSGVAAAKALEAGTIDGFWANAMGAQNAIASGVGKVILDIRRGIGPKAAFHYTMPVLVTSDKAIGRDPEGFAKQSDRLTAAAAEHEQAEERWLELEMLKEQVGG